MKDRCLNRLEELSNFNTGWLDGEGCQLIDSSLSDARNFVEQCETLSENLGIFPMEDGGISFEFDTKEYGISIQFEQFSIEIFGIYLHNRKNFSFTVEKNDIDSLCFFMELLRG